MLHCLRKLWSHETSFFHKQRDNVCFGFCNAMQCENVGHLDCPYQMHPCFQSERTYANFKKNNLCNLFIQAIFFIPPLKLNVSCVLQKRCVPSTKHDEECSLVKNIDAIIKTFICLLNRQNTCFFYNNIIHQSSSCSGSQPYPSSPSSGSYWHPSGIPTCGTGTNQSVGRPSRAKAARPASTASCEFVIAKSP